MLLLVRSTIHSQLILKKIQTVFFSQFFYCSHFSFLISSSLSLFLLHTLSQTHTFTALFTPLSLIILLLNFHYVTYRYKNDL
jgi:hypothetical protein